jgi:hypothetical protein
MLAARWEGRVVAAADVVVFNSAAVAQATAAGYPNIGPAKVRVILNGSDAPRRAAATPIPRDIPIRFRHFGTLYQGRSLEPLLHALRALRDERAVDIELYGASEWRAATTVPAVRITQWGTVTHSEAIAAMREPAILVLVQPQHFNRQIPTKLFEYLCTGNPVLVLASRHSAAWALAAQYARCFLLEYGAEDSHGSTVSALVDQWRNGKLRQEATAGDTGHFTKASVGREFVEIVRAVSRSGGCP